MNEIRLSRGSHPAPFDDEGNATLCIMEYSAYLAGEPHSDAPECVSHVLTAFMVTFNDALDDEARQRLRRYAVRQIGTAGDGQDETRGLLALDWLVRVQAPAFLEAAGLTDHADSLRALATIDAIEQVKAAERRIRTARTVACAVGRDATSTAGPATGAGGNAAFSAASVASASRDDAEDAAWSAVGAAVSAVLGTVAWSALEAYRRGALRATVEMLQESAFDLLERMIDPNGMHDVTVPEEARSKTTA